MVTLGRELLERDPSQLLEYLERQARRLLVQQAELSTCRQQLAELQSEVEALKQEVTSRVAPFRRKKPKGQNPPKKPGRQPGHRGEWLQSPPSAASDEHIEVSLEVCPDCGNALDARTQRVVEQTIIEAPVVMPRVIRLRTYRNHCECCQKQVNSTQKTIEGFWSVTVCLSTMISTQFNKNATLITD